MTDAGGTAAAADSTWKRRGTARHLRGDHVHRQGRRCEEFDEAGGAQDEETEGGAGHGEREPARLMRNVR